MQFTVNQVLYRGKITNRNPPLLGSVDPEKSFFGAHTGFLQGYQCPRCKNSWGFYHPSPEGVMFFCGDDECLKDDCAASKPTGEKKDFIDKKHIPGLGTRYSTACLSKLLVDIETQRAISNWCKNPKDFLVAYGKPGKGKTYLCAALCYKFMNEKFLVHEGEQVIERNVEFKYTETVRFIEELHKAINSKKGQYNAVKYFADMELLILDDLGCTTNNDWQKEVILDLINQRYANNKPTVITTNFDQNAMTQHLGERLSRRIFNTDNLIIEV